MKYLARYSLLILLIITLTSCSSFTQEQIKNGFNEIAYSPLQISTNIREETPKAQFPPFGAVGGSVKGGFYMIKDILIGILRIATSFKGR